jgi:hypothetical protein
MSAVRKVKAAGPKPAPMPPQAVIEGNAETVREMLFEAGVLMDLVKTGLHPNNDQRPNEWSMYQAVKKAGELLTDAANQLEWGALSEAKPEGACHE